MGDRRSRRASASFAALAAGTALVALSVLGGDVANAITYTPDPVTGGRFIIAVDLDDGDLTGWAGHGATLSLTDVEPGDEHADGQDNRFVLRADGLDSYGEGVSITLPDDVLGGPSWFSSSVRMKLPAGSPSTYFQVFAGDIPAGPATEITDQAWTHIGFGTPYNGSTTAGLPGTSTARDGYTWSIRAVYECRQSRPGPAPSVLVDNFRLVRFENPDLSWPVRDYTMDCPAVPAVAPPFADDEAQPFSVIRSWGFEDGVVAPFSTYGGVSLATSAEFPSEGSRGLVATWDGVHPGDLQVEVPGKDLVIGRYYALVASARLAPGTPPRHWGYSTRPSAWQQQFSGVNPPTWINFEFQYQGNNRAVIHLAQFLKNVSWCGTVENAPSRVYLDQVELRVSANQAPVNYPTPSCPVLTTTTATTTTDHTTTSTTTTRPSSSTTTRMVDRTTGTTTTWTTWRPPTSTTSARPTTTSARPTTTTSRLDQWPTTTAGSPSAGCRAEYRVTSTWPGYVQATVKVTALTSLKAWAASFPVPQGAALNQSWSAKVTQAGTKLTATNETWNGKLPAGASTEFGLIIKGGGTTIPAVACS